MPTVTRSKSKEDTIMTEQLLASMQSMQASIATMNQSVMDLTNSVGQLRIDMDGIKDSVKFNQNEQKEFKNAISAINEKIKVREDREDHIITKLNEVTKENKLIKEKLLALDVYIRRENLKFSGLMEDDNESALQCQKKIYGLFKNQLKIVNPERIEFQRCHRLSRKTDGKTRDIIVRFLKFPTAKLGI